MDNGIYFSHPLARFVQCFAFLLYWSYHSFMGEYSCYAPVTAGVARMLAVFH